MTCQRCKTSEGKLADEWLSDDLPIELANFVDQCFFETLCSSCIDELHHKFHQLDSHEDVYLENHFVVFTEAYHLRRGYCCRSKCRHCPYGY